MEPYTRQWYAMFCTGYNRGKCTNESVDLELLTCQYLFSHLKPSVIFVDRVSKIYSFSLAHKLAKLWLILHTQVVSHKIAIDAISAALFEAIQNVGGLKVKTRFKNVKIYISYFVIKKT